MDEGNRIGKTSGWLLTASDSESRAYGVSRPGHTHSQRLIRRTQSESTMSASTDARTYKVIVKYADSDGWVSPEGRHARPSMESNPFLAIIGGAMRGDYTYAEEAHEQAGYVLLVDNSTVWGVARIIRIATDRFTEQRVRRLIVDPMDAPSDLQELVGTRVPPIRQFTTATFADDVLTYASGITNRD